MDEIVVAGARAVIAVLRKPRRAVAPIDFEAERERKRQVEETVAETTRTIVHRVEIGSAVVEYLDKMMVGGKRLGDCAHADLIREQASLTHRGEACLSQARLLARIAERLAPNETVRTSTGRAQILELLGEHFAT